MLPTLLIRRNIMLTWKHTIGQKLFSYVICFYIDFLHFYTSLTPFCTFLIASWLNFTIYPFTFPTTCVPSMVPYDWICLIIGSNVLVTMNSQGINLKVTTTGQAEVCWFPWIVKRCKRENTSHTHLLLGLLLVDF
jgi:hypothetical protein